MNEVSENRYEGMLPYFVKPYKDTLPRHPKITDITAIAKYVIEQTYSMANATGFGDFYASQYGISEPEAKKQLEADGIMNAGCILVSEAKAMFDGIVVHVADRGLVEALARTEIDALVGDVRLPFPVMEIVYPRGIILPSGCEASGTLVVDFRHPSVQQTIKEIGIEYRKASPEHQADLFILVWPKVNGKTQSVSPLIERFSLKNSLSDSRRCLDITDDEMRMLREHSLLALSLFLYVQSIENRRAMTPASDIKPQSRGLPSGLARIDKKRPRYSIRDIFPDKHTSGRSHNLHHSSPTSHWRVGHMRSLRHERFRRNENGSVKVVWIRPSKINPGDDPATSERKLEY